MLVRSGSRGCAVARRASRLSVSAAFVAYAERPRLDVTYVLMASSEARRTPFAEESQKIMLSAAAGVASARSRNGFAPCAEAERGEERPSAVRRRNT